MVSSSDSKAIFREFITTTNSRQTYDTCGEQYISRLEDYLSANQLKMDKIELSDDDFDCRMRFWPLACMNSCARWGDVRRNKI